MLGGPQQHRGNHREQQDRQQCFADTQSRGQDAVEGTGGRQPDGRGHRGQHQRHHPAEADVEEDHHSGREEGLEGGQLDGHCARLAEEQRRAVQPGQAQPVPGSVLGLDRKGPPHGQQGAEEHGDPEQARRRAAEHPWLGVQREGEEQQHDQPEGQDLLGRDPRPGLDSKILARDEGRLLEEVHARVPDGVVPRARLGEDGSVSASPGAGSVPCAWPAVSTTSREASGRARSSSCDAKTTDRPAADESASTASSAERPRRRGRRGVRREATGEGSAPSRPRTPTGVAGRPRAAVQQRRAAV